MTRMKKGSDQFSVAVTTSTQTRRKAFAKISVDSRHLREVFSSKFGLPVAEPDGTFAAAYAEIINSIFTRTTI